MASNRHLGRIVALQTLYEFEFRTQSGDTSASAHEILDRNLERYESAIQDKAFVRELVDGVIAQQSDLDGKIQPIAPEWPIEQIARVDRTILRMGLFELLHRGAIVPVRIAKVKAPPQIDSATLNPYALPSRFS